MIVLTPVTCCTTAIPIPTSTSRRIHGTARSAPPAVAAPPPARLLQPRAATRREAAPGAPARTACPRRRPGAAGPPALANLSTAALPPAGVSPKQRFRPALTAQQHIFGLK